MARAIIGGVIVAIVALARCSRRWLAPHDPNEQDLLTQLLPPVWAPAATPRYPLGTDNLGRYMLSRLIYGARVAMIVAVVGLVGAMLLGTTLALLAGYFGGWSIGSSPRRSTLDVRSRRWCSR